MAVRLLLLITVVGLVLTGCNTHRGSPHPKKRVAATPAAYHKVAGYPYDLRGAADRKVAHARHSNAPYTLDSGDRLRVTVFGQENLSRIYAVDGGGNISMPLIGAVKARGATTYEMEDRIAAQLKREYLKDPKVTVEIQTYRPFFILGEVREPGQFPYVNGMTVQTAVAIAGGYTPRALEDKVQLTRRIDGRSITRMVPARMPVQPGDTIYVKERFF